MAARDTDKHFMRRAVFEARKGIGLTSPNPAVGAVLVVQKRIVARGHHRGAGFPHAEIECLCDFGRRVPRNATLYVTLEPCSTTGRTSACTSEIIRAGLKKIVIGAIDPNPRHAGRGIEILRHAGIEVRQGVLEDQCTVINEAFNKWIVAREPFVVAKCGMTLDGRLTRPPKESRWITGLRARQEARELRANVDAILIGAETLRKDNPRLTVRGIRQARQPFRVIITRSKKLPAAADLFTDRFASKTLVYRNRSLTSVLRDLGKRNVTAVLIEGGGNVLSQALDARKIDKFQIYLGPVLSGGPVLAFGGKGTASTSQATRLKAVRFQILGNDVSMSGYPVYPGQSDVE